MRAEGGEDPIRGVGGRGEGLGGRGDGEDVGREGDDSKEKTASCEKMN